MTIKTLRSNNVCLKKYLMNIHLIFGPIAPERLFKQFYKLICVVD
jgi:hypothetical protein